MSDLSLWRGIPDKFEYINHFSFTGVPLQAQVLHVEKSFSGNKTDIL